ncbi:MAG: excinuclease ABC subunit UvrA [Bacteroidales bacterium]
MSEENNIKIRKAHVNNLKNIDVAIPRDKFVVITGLSGSGKSSLAFETLYAEGQRRYVESLSSYARQFLGRMSKPECDSITGIPPAIAIEQKVNSRNPRSTVGTSTEIYTYLRMLFARIGKTYSPKSGELIKRHSVEDLISVVTNPNERYRIALLAPINIPTNRDILQQLEIYLKQGFNRVDVGDHVVEIEDILSNNFTINDGIMPLLLIDRVATTNDPDTISRFADSVETAFFEGHNRCILKLYKQDGEIETQTFSKEFEADGFTFEEPTDTMFNFNSPAGACPVCEGFGQIVGVDPNLVIPNKSLSIFQDAVVCWKGEKMSEWKNELINSAHLFNFPIHKPYNQLDKEQKDLLWRGNSYFGGINTFFKMLEESSYKIQCRVMLARYRGKTICPECNGTRLKRGTQYVKIGNKSIGEIVTLPISELRTFFDNLVLDEKDSSIAQRLLIEINNRINFLIDVGLGYLTLDRLSSTLSGGESQRINLATSLSSALVGSLYILDEPSIGLHPRDTKKLINVIRQLQQQGNSVIVVEHDEEIMRAADYIIDIGPDAGRLGGEVVYQGDINKLIASDRGYTVQYLTGKETIDTPIYRRKWNSYIEVKNATHNNLKGIDVKFPLNVMSVVTGVSGSGKSSLVRDVFYKNVKQQFSEANEQPGASSGIFGDINRVKAIEFVNQNPIGRSSRSNPCTYLKAYDEIRKLFSDQPLSKQMGYSPGVFSLNTDGGRCDECKGEGTTTVEMQFMADIELTCESCNGARFKKEILEVLYHGKCITDILDMTVNEAIEFFGKEGKSNTEKKIVKRLLPLQQVGLGYIKLGQSSSTLSGGESQRVKLAFILSGEKSQPTIFVFDEPTTGLHFHDIKTLLKAFNALIENGHTVLIIEHNIDVIKCADHIIDIGPEGGDQGGYLVCEGTPEEVAKCNTSYTGQYLRDHLYK